MKQLLVKGNKLILGDLAPCMIDDLFTSDFFKESDSLSDNFKNGTYVENELFIGIIQPALALRKWILDNKIDEIDVEKANEDLYSYLVDIAQKEGISLLYHKRSLLLRKKLFAYFQVILSTGYLIYLMLKIPYKKESKSMDNEFSVIRDKKAELKMRSFNFKKEYEDPKSKNSIYRLTPRFTRVLWVLKSFWNSCGELKKYKKLINKYVGKNSIAKIYSFYGKRVVHMLLYYQLIDNYFSKRVGRTFYTGNNLDRFSVIEEELAQKYNLKTICIPHGLEYGFKFPKGFSCSIFYATSLYAAEYLNKLYQTQKFVFENSIVENIFKIESKPKGLGGKIVFFTEPREVNVNKNILDSLIPLMGASNITLYLKLHPFDDKKNYSEYPVEYISDQAEALVDNICFSRKSTTLLEAVYNNSKAAAILTNTKDTSIFYTFPSLQSEQIKVTTSVDQLFKWIYSEHKQLSLR